MGISKRTMTQDDNYQSPQSPYIPQRTSIERIKRHGDFKTVKCQVVDEADTGAENIRAAPRDKS
jgi:hypothetical protein